MTELESQTPTQDQNDLGFDAGLKKKKKKKAVNFDDVENVEQQPESKDEGDEIFSGLKKKSKKKKDVSEATDEQPAVGVGDDEDFGELKKKKKSSKKKANFDLEAFDKELDEGKPTVEQNQQDDQLTQESTNGENGEPWLGTERDYTYKELLSRTFKLLHSQNPTLVTGSRRYTIAPPQVVRDGNKKTAFANIADICKRMHRQPEHVIQFLFAELGTSGSVDGSQRLVIRGRFQQKQIENVLRRYIIEYVTCKTCKSPETTLTKENRLYFMTCEACGSRRSVAAIKSGFQAQIGKRKAQVK